jgi:2-polyprenyl-6-methoxyphenol hydroxylase-like FAD-dependent oxidoreductase
VELQFESGHEDVADLLVGADGINSSVANILNIDDEIRPIYSGANIIRRWGYNLTWLSSIQM